MSPTADSPNRPAVTPMLSMLKVCAALRRSQRSAYAPNTGPSTATGKYAANATAATKNSDSVSCQACHPRASRRIHRPCVVMVLPIRKRR